MIGRIGGFVLACVVAGLAGCGAPAEWEEQTRNSTAVRGFWDRNTVKKTALTARMNTAEIRVYQPLDKQGLPVGELEAISRERELLVDCDWGLVTPAGPTAFEINERGWRKKQTVRDSQENPFPIGWEAGLFDRFCEGPRGRRSALYLRFNQIVRRAVASDLVWKGKPEDVYTADKKPIEGLEGPWVPVSLDAKTGRALYINIQPETRIMRQAGAITLTLVRGERGQVRFLAARAYAFECEGQQRVHMLAGETQDLELGQKAVLGSNGPWPTASLPLTTALRTAACTGVAQPDAPADLAAAIKDAEARWR